MFQQKLIAGIIVLIGIAIFNQYGWAEEFNWNRWKGPDQTGVSQETDWDVKALDKPLKVNWRKKIGPGYSNVAVQDGTLYTMGYDEKKKVNILYCFEAETGKELWKYKSKAKKGTYKGPKSTPVIDEGRVYTFSQDGLVFCNDAGTGKLIWKKDTVKALGGEVLRWRISSSVLIEGDKLILNTCESGVALNKKNGKVIWKSAPGAGNYSTPVSYTVDGQPMLAIFGKRQLNAVDLQTGKVQWSFPWKTRYTIVAADPVVMGKTMFISSGYNNGCALIDFSSGQAEQVWRSKEVSTHFSTAIVIDDYLYAVDGNAGSDGRIKCINPDDGSVQWSKELGFGNMMAAGGHLIFLSEFGTVTIIKADPKAYTPISSKDNVIRGTCWTAPVLCNGNLYVRNEKGDLASISLKK